MKLFHGSIDLVAHPKILQSNRRLDYGDGFYTTTNRTQRGFTHDYDIVYGPVANDKVYLQFGLYENGAISVETLIRELKTYKLVDQYLFHTEKALTTLHFMKAIKIE